ILGPDEESPGVPMTLQGWVDGRIADTQKQIDAWHLEQDAKIKEAKTLEDLPESPHLNKRKQELSSSMAKLEGRLASAQTALWRYQLTKNYLIGFLPPDRFETLAWLIGLVVLAVAIKGFFEFWQESLVGSVVNRSLYDLRNRFFRTAVHLDVNDFGKE